MQVGGGIEGTRTREWEWAMGGDGRRGALVRPGPGPGAGRRLRPRAKEGEAATRTAASGTLELVGTRSSPALLCSRQANVMCDIAYKLSTLCSYYWGVPKLMPMRPTQAQDGTSDRIGTALLRGAGATAWGRAGATAVGLETTEIETEIRTEIKTEIRTEIETEIGIALPLPPKPLLESGRTAAAATT